MWDDMDRLFDLVGVRAFFDGHTPKSNYEICRYNRTIDDMLENCTFAPRRYIACQEDHSGPIKTLPTTNAKKSAFAKNDINTYEPIAITHRLFYSKYAYHTTKDFKRHLYDWNFETLKVLLEEQLKKAADESQIKQSKGEEKGKAKAATSQITLLDQNGIVTHVTVLKALREALEKESKALHFDFLSFHVTCYQLMIAMRLKLRRIVDDVSDP